MTNYKNRCAELAQHLDDTLDFTISSETRKYLKALISTVRSELAEPEMEGPTNEDLIQLAIDTRLYRFQATAGDPIQYEMTEQQIHAFARAVLARWGK